MQLVLMIYRVIKINFFLILSPNTLWKTPCFAIHIICLPWKTQCPNTTNWPKQDLCQQGIRYEYPGVYRESSEGGGEYLRK